MNQVHTYNTYKQTKLSIHFISNLLLVLCNKKQFNKKKQYYFIIINNFISINIYECRYILLVFKTKLKMMYVQMFKGKIYRGFMFYLKRGNEIMTVITLLLLLAKNM